MRNAESPPVEPHTTSFADIRGVGDLKEDKCLEVELEQDTIQRHKTTLLTGIHAPLQTQSTRNLGPGGRRPSGSP